MLSKSEESDLITRALAGNQSAFRQLYENHVDGLFAFMSQFSRDREQSREWTQRAFIKAFHKLSTFNEKARFKSWLFTIALNEMRTDMRKPIRFVELDTSGLKEDPVLEIEKEEIRTQTREAIQELEPDKKMVFLLFEAEEYSHREIGEMLDITEGTSRVILHRARKELQQILKP